MAKDRLTKLYLALLYASVFSYLFYTVEAIRTKTQILWTYASARINISAPGIYFVYIKDFLTIILFLALFQKKGKITKPVVIFCGIIIYGIIILLVNDLNLNYIIAGFRALLYFIVALMVAKEMVYDGDVAKTIERINRAVYICVIIESIVVAIQISISSAWMQIGTGGYRFCGTFGNAAAMGAFCISALFVMLVYSQKICSTGLFCIGCGLLCVFLSIASGSRMSMMLTWITFLAVLNDYLGKKVKIKKRDRIIFLLIVAIMVASPMYTYMIERTGRGELMDSGSTRSDLLLSLLSDDSEPLSLIFGHGLGYGTNAAVNMEIKDSPILDGTFTTILAQFGLIGLVTFFLLSIKIYAKLFRYNKDNLIVPTIALVDYSVMCITINIFEQTAFNVIGVMMFFLFFFLTEELNKKNEFKYSGNFGKVHTQLKN